MNEPLKSHAHTALEAFLGHWRGSTELSASPWGPARTADAEVTFSRAAGGYALVQSYRHIEPDGTHFEGHGVFTVDPDHGDTMWYYVDSMGRPPEARPADIGRTAHCGLSAGVPAGLRGTPSRWTAAC